MRMSIDFSCLEDLNNASFNYLYLCVFNPFARKERVHKLSAFNLNYLFHQKVINPIVEILCFFVGRVAVFGVQMDVAIQLLGDLCGGLARGDLILRAAQNKNGAVDLGQTVVAIELQYGRGKCRKAPEVLGLNHADQERHEKLVLFQVSFRVHQREGFLVDGDVVLVQRAVYPITDDLFDVFIGS